MKRTARMSLALVCATLCACGGIRVRDVANPSPRLMTPHTVAPPTEFTLGATADAVIHNQGRWADEPLGGLEWIRVDARPHRDLYWITFLRFDLSVVPEGVSIAAATLRLPGDPTDGDTSVQIYEVITPWDEESVSWRRQPEIAPQRLRNAVLLNDGETPDEVDLTRVIAARLDEGGRSFSLAIVPDVAKDSDGRVWRSRESAAPDAQNGTTVATLHLVAGDSLAPPTAAELDVASGGRQQIGED